MPDLIAQGEEPQQRWRRSLPVSQDVVLGRSGRGWGVPWDAQVSRHHVRLRWDGYRLQVRRDPEARNPVYLRGQEVAQFELQPGEHFVIGQTTFTLADQRVTLTAATPQPVQQQSFSAPYLRQVPFRN
ncbi:MAG: FHA domain-containing protein, partial [Patescibacteria group bacterium]|nr:FHA domain-containing protein [Patescibacteria group bacterium]